MPSSAVYLIVGLGNPGEEYRETRHNLGFRVIRKWCHEAGVCLSEHRFHARYARVHLDYTDVVLCCPLTFMNRSGMAVGALAVLHGVPPERLLVVHDDLDLPLGRLKLIRGGGAGGHRGVESIIGHLGSDAFPRLKIGIGRPPRGVSPEEYVLTCFPKQERETVQQVVLLAVQAGRWALSKGLDAAMNHFNQRNLNEKEGIN